MNYPRASKKYMTLKQRLVSLCGLTVGINELLKMKSLQLKFIYQL